MAAEEEKIPELTLEPTFTAEPEAPAAPAFGEEKQEAKPAGPDMSSLTPKEQQAVLAFADKINISDSNMVLQYGAGAQKNIADFSENALASVRTKDLGQIGDMISGLVVELKSFDANEEEKKGLFGLFHKAGTNLESMKLRYSKVEGNVDRIAENLQQHQMVLMKDIALMDQMYEKNMEYYKQLTMYILAGQKKLQEEKEVTLPALRAKAQASGSAEDAQAANDYENRILRFEKKLHDLELTRVISLQMAPQIRLLQNNNTVMTEKIQTTIVNTIPLWKSQMVLALGIQHSRQAMEAEHAVTEMTNELLKKNAAMLHQSSVEVAREAERSVVDIETLQTTNQELISTLDEVLQIQTEGAQKRADAEVELRRIEGELKQKLLETRQVSR